MSSTVVLSALLATVGVVDGSSRAMAAGRQRSDAGELADAELEAMRALPPEQLAHRQGDPAVPASFEGRPTVVSEQGAVRPSGSSERDGTTYGVRRRVTWEAVDAGGRQDPEGVKRLTVEVSWGGHVVRRDGGVARPVASTCLQEWTDADVAHPVADGFVAVEGAVGAGATSVPLGLQRSGPMPLPGDLVMVVQMTGTDAGHFEYAVAGSNVDGGRLTVSGTGVGGGLRNGYHSDAAGAAQVVRVPTVARLRVDRLEAPAFDGRIGGVVAVDVAGEVVGPTEVDVAGRGPAVAVPPAVAAPALRAGSGSPGAPGGGVVSIRASRIDGRLRVLAGGASGAVGGGAGTVLLRVGSGLSGVEVVASGGVGTAGAGGAGGAVVASGTPGLTDVRGGSGTPPGTVGRVDVGLVDDDVPGPAGPVGCLPAVTVTKSTSTPVVTTAGGGAARWTVTVANGPWRGTAAGLRLRDVLAPGLAYVATESVRLSGGATRDPADDPAPFAVDPSWGTFDLPAGAAVELTFRVAVAEGMQGAVGNGATAEYTAGGLSMRGGYAAESSAAEDVRLRAYPCDVPWTDPDPGDVTGTVNTYAKVTAPVAAGATSVPIGTESGGRAARVGDLVLIVQMTGTGAGRHEYAVVTGRPGGAIRVDGLGAGGGLVNGYGADGVAQVVRVPTYPTLTVTRAITAPTWNGSVGGVVALDVTGALTWSGGSLDASSRGPSAGSGSGRDGGMVLVRAGAVAGTAARALANGATGTVGGRGGKVEVLTLTGGVAPLAVQAKGGRGSRTSGAGGSVLISGPAASVDVSGGGTGAPAGTVVATARPRDTVGVGLGAGCRPVLDVVADAVPARTWRVRGATVPLVVTVTALAGRSTVEAASVTAWLPVGAGVATTDRVELAGGATRRVVGDPPPDTAAPRWGDFDLPGGSSVTVYATVSLGTLDPATLVVPATAIGNGPTGVVSVASGTGANAADVNLLAVAGRRTPTAVSTSLAGTLGAPTAPLPATTLAVPTAFGGSFVELDTGSGLLPPAETFVITPAPVRPRVGVRLRPGSPTEEICLYGEAVDLLDGSVIGTGGPMGSPAAPAGCVTGPTAGVVEVDLPARLWSARSLDDVGVRWYLRSRSGGTAVVEASWLAFDWQDATWTAPAVKVSGPLLGASRTDPLLAVDGVTARVSSLPVAADPARAVDLAMAVPLAGDATVVSASAVLQWRRTGSGSVCVSTQWLLDGAPSGAVSAPVCRSSSSWYTQRIDAGARPAAELGRLGLRILPTGSSTAGVLEVDDAHLEASWWRR